MTEVRIIPDVEMSDLFFNHEHPNYEEVFESAEPSSEEWRFAIYKDANEFIKNYPTVCQGYDHEWIGDNFLARL